jgi:hypothetical protein
MVPSILGVDAVVLGAGNVERSSAQYILNQLPAKSLLMRKKYMGHVVLERQGSLKTCIAVEGIIAIVISDGNGK